MKILTGLSATFDSLTKVIISLLGLGIVVSLLGGNDHCHIHQPHHIEVEISLQNL